MKIAIIGYGKMGHEIASIAVEKGHAVACTIDNDTEMLANIDLLKSSDVAIEFTTPATAVTNIKQCLQIGVPVVCGTTGWYDSYDEVCALCREKGGALFTATNFSIGMNIVFDLNRRLAALMDKYPQYKASIVETHHIHKLDAPSGTAITLREQTGHPEIEITSIREGEVPGTHVVRYDSAVDTIMLTHEAHSRRGLAEGAVLAAEFLKGKTGIFTMTDLLV